MVEVFKTDVCEIAHADELVDLLRRQYPGARVSFDLEDRDNVLRIEAKNVLAEHVIFVMKTRGCTCEVLE